ncbi:pyruvate ferredoxin/flavodoxin oxidoreductase, beta subunit [Methanococcus vannielii SB]|jgi:2-oxoglutarate ferredoxin oxidoreductase subunit beta|uniref:Pyruvate ferredoxin/flavodoxin oxidoreductase, beta subunit n=1 Tax=Methanococcus vannielii (strain ATCC 35089 / DSM 1224 / JCM 13029 / OCM 148 / SB) TaxID=406327 RepID=A6URU1_METVS|nr:thiamine pyrophosphate-dependent enzyme [Methanococcus vannielii]ABR55213.1 pyruvate ferredoxin/flavodoxin oxidoreductase, beta subunit [Methanococcus vannielii SB]
MNSESFDRIGKIDISWCPGCGNFAIRNSLTKALSELSLKPTNTALISGIGQAGKMPHHILVNGFHALHGRAIPTATAVKAVNPNLTVIAEGGDGDMYAEGGNHLIHAIRRNPDITVLIHNNQIYGLTKGQASPTTLINTKTPTQPFGVFEEPLNPIALAISLNASFVARTFSGYVEETKEIIKQAISHKGLSIVDIFHNCPSFNKVNTVSWYQENTYFMYDHDPQNRKEAFNRALENEKYPLGVFYICKKPIFEEKLPAYEKNKTPIWNREPVVENIDKIINSKKV